MVDPISVLDFLGVTSSPKPEMTSKSDSRDPSPTIQKTAQLIHDEIFGSESLKQVLRHFPGMLMILNGARQIVFASDEVYSFLDPDKNFLLGRRPGEALRCINAEKTPQGCGTSEPCSSCGALLSILAAQRGESVQNECSVLTEKGEQFSLLVNAAPFDIRGKPYTLFGISNITDKTRRRYLERAFFHDILNTAGALKGMSELALDGSARPESLKDFFETIYPLSVQLMDEIHAQRDLLAAESDELTCHFEDVHSTEFLEKIRKVFSVHPLAKDKKILLANDCENFQFATDRRLLWRVVVNLLKNALEASGPGDQITLGCRRRDDATVHFWVHNPAVIPPEILPQIFARSVSSKGEGRGLGTLSVKLLTEKFLGGKAGFTSRKGEGTTFYVIYPAG